MNAVTCTYAIALQHIFTGQKGSNHKPSILKGELHLVMEGQNDQKGSIYTQQPIGIHCRVLIKLFGFWGGMERCLQF